MQYSIPMKTRLLTALTTLCLTLSLTCTLFADPLEVGAQAPRLVGTTHLGKELNLETLYKRGLVLVFFYPKAHTGGCTKEVCGIRDNWDVLRKIGLEVVGVSMDKVEDQASFVTEQRLAFPLLADPEGKIVQAFGVPEMKPGIPKRQSFLMKDGKVVWRDLEVKPEAHVAAVKEAIAAAIGKKME
jgi:thioredoxin-dependent peroxiredoxin